MILGVTSADWTSPRQAEIAGGRWGAVGWIRFGQWLPLLAEHVDLRHGLLWFKHDHFEVEQVFPDGSSEFVAPDVVVMHLHQTDVAANIRTARASGQVVIQDLDDWYWGLDTRNAAFNYVAAGQRHFAGNLMATDIITTSTPYLAKRLGEKFSAEIVHIPNYLDMHRFTPTDHDVDVATIGWVGATEARSGDLAEMRGILSQLRGQARFQHSGYRDGAPRFASEVGLNDDEVNVLPRCQVDQYPTLLNFQIGLVPLRMTPFNEAKSELKGLEYAAAGIPFVASPSGVYRDLATAWGDGAQAPRRPGDVVKALRRLLDHGYRTEVAERLRKSALERHLTEGLHHYLDLYARFN